MRDLLLTAIVFGSIPFILRNPFNGLLMWIWLGIMNPHRLTWGFAYSMPFALIVALATFTGMLLKAKSLYKFPRDRAAIALVLFFFWLCVSPLFSFHPEQELEMWLRPAKILLMCLIALLLVGTRDQLHKMTWVLALSIGFFGIKGGIFTIATGGAYRVRGPEDSFIYDNNALALAIIMSVPLFRYLQLQSENVWIKRGCLAAMILCVISALGSYSRGALLALIAMGLFLFAKSRQKLLIGLLIVLVVPMVLYLMPEHWFARMNTIAEYNQDASALGRLNAWWAAWNLALDRFPIGGGYAIYEADVYARYAPNPDLVLAAHSIYFQVLGQHGFMGLFLFLLIYGFSWLNGAWIVRNTKGKVGLEWAHDLAAMCQVSLVGYAVGGAFLSLTYFDLPYYIVIILIVLRTIVRQVLAEMGRNGKLQQQKEVVLA